MDMCQPVSTFQKLNSFLSFSFLFRFFSPSLIFFFFYSFSYSCQDRGNIKITKGGKEQVKEAMRDHTAGVMGRTEGCGEAVAIYVCIHMFTNLKSMSRF